MKNLFDFFLKKTQKLNSLQKQNILYYGCISVGTLICFSVVWNVLASPGMNITKGAAPTEKLLTGADRLNPQDAWNERMNNQFEMQAKEIADLKKLVIGLTDALHKSNKETISPQKEQLSLTTNDPTRSIPKPGVLDMSVPDLFIPPQNNTKPVVTQTEVKKRFRSTGISKNTIALQNSRMGKILNTVDNTIPSGSFVQGVLISGIDASTGTSAAGNPEPVLIELTDSGDLSRYFTSTVKGCRVTAAGYGVLSKERVMMRLEKLSCIEAETGEVMETEIDGYVSGEDGRAGLRGTVVDKAGAQMRSSVMAGFMTSFSNFLAASSNPVMFAPQTGLAQMSSLTGSDLLKQGASKGVSGALDRYIEYSIKRAEQIEPIIQIGAGRVVQVVFSKSVGIGKSITKHTIASRNDKIRVKTLDHLNVNNPNDSKELSE